MFTGNFTSKNFENLCPNLQKPPLPSKILLAYTSAALDFSWIASKFFQAEAIIFLKVKNRKITSKVFLSQSVSLLVGIV